MDTKYRQIKGKWRCIYVYVYVQIQFRINTPLYINIILLITIEQVIKIIINCFTNNYLYPHTFEALLKNILSTFRTPILSYISKI